MSLPRPLLPGQAPPPTNGVDAVKF